MGVNDFKAQQAAAAAQAAAQKAALEAAAKAKAVSASQQAAATIAKQSVPTVPVTPVTISDFKALSNSTASSSNSSSSSAASSAAAAAKNGASSPSTYYTGATSGLGGVSVGGAANPSLSMDELAARWGWSMAVLNAVPELKGLFSRAVSESWSEDRFTAELYNTTWYKTNGDAARQAIKMQTTDPATWNQILNSSMASIRNSAASVGALLNDAQVQQMATDATVFGWNSEQTLRAMRQYVTFANGQMFGLAKARRNEIDQYADVMGVTVGESQANDWAADAATGISSMNSILGAIQNIAESTYSWLAPRFRNGETYASIANPYKQTMAALLEMAPTEITNKDETIKRAMSHKDVKTGVQGLRTLWEFENDLRNDVRWRKTQNAQDAGMAVVNGLGKLFGKIS